MKKILFVLAMFLITASVFGQIKDTVTCKIWKTKNFRTIPDSVNVPDNLFFNGTTFSEMSCGKLKKWNFVGVWVTFEGKNNEKLYLKSHFKNISLVRKNSKEKLHPIYYMEGVRPVSEGVLPMYINNKSTFKSSYYNLKPTEKYDLFMLFKKAEVGDKIIIDDFLEAEICGAGVK